MARARTKAPLDGVEAGISRIDQAGKQVHGWSTRVNLGNKTLVKFFADKNHGSPDEALAAARAHRAAVMSAINGDQDLGLDTLYITRMNYARAKGWWVRVAIARGERVSRLFSDSDFVSPEAARVAAVRWRDAMIVFYNITPRRRGRRQPSLET